MSRATARLPGLPHSGTLAAADTPATAATAGILAVLGWSAVVASGAGLWGLVLSLIA